MKVEKRDGKIVDFEKKKIVHAILQAMKEGNKVDFNLAKKISEKIEYFCQGMNKKISVETIQDLVEEELMKSGMYDIAKRYIRYRYKREMSRDLNNRYESFTTLVNGTNDEANKENSNKDTRIIPTMRDYLAGFTCKEMAEKFILPKDIMEAHKAGIIHFHDMDYSPAMPMTNCSLINLEDMLQNGTVISGTMIEKPHSFRTACTVVTQVVTQVASCQYGLKIAAVSKQL